MRVIHRLLGETFFAGTLILMVLGAATFFGAKLGYLNIDHEDIIILVAVVAASGAVWLLFGRLIGERRSEPDCPSPESPLNVGLAGEDHSGISTSEISQQKPPKEDEAMNTPTEEADIPTGKFCSTCGNTLHIDAEICPKCGVRQPHTRTSVGGKSKMVAGFLAILFGGLGVHKFYLNQGGTGIAYAFIFLVGLLAFAIPSMVIAAVAFVEGIIYFATDDEKWNAKHNS